MEHKEKYYIRFKEKTNNMDVVSMDVLLNEKQFYNLENILLIGNINHTLYIKRVFLKDCIEENRIIEFDSIYLVLYAIRESLNK